MRVLPALLATCLASASLALPAATPVAPALRAGTFEPPRQAPDFTLRSSDGNELSLARLRGKVVLMSFGFSHCAAVCPVTLATLAEARRSLGKAGEAVQVVFVTVDPERDDVARLKAHMAAFDPSFIGATGTPAALAAMRKDYGVTARKVPTGDGYVMDHSSSVYLIDRGGKLRALMPYGRSAGDYAHDVKLLLGS
ncbi:SCO family protein [Schlegelella sp. ID0723]|uniref:SCO family protein n=2 Tax=Piscinibacter koreensis TaxID=2742824 RepID=A0A7Y6NKE6_9BURK|nr:SCO family protein [Schlegelella koreensis]